MMAQFSPISSAIGTPKFGEVKVPHDTQIRLIDLCGLTSQDRLMVFWRDAKQNILALKTQKNFNFSPRGDHQPQNPQRLH